MSLVLPAPKREEMKLGFVEVLSGTSAQMVPSTVRRSSRIRTQYCKRQQQQQQQQQSLQQSKHHEDLPCKTESSAEKTSKAGDEEDTSSTVTSNLCCTPKGKKFRIPKIESCPPAPKKRRLATHCAKQRSPIPFFASPDIELFFFSSSFPSLGVYQSQMRCSVNRV